MRQQRPVTSITLVMLMGTACGMARDEASYGVDTAGVDSACMSDSWWNRGNSGSPLMRPGGDCIGCHQDMGEGPRYTVAGTVYRELDEPDDCDGAMNVVVEIVDAKGDVWTQTVNSAGNFFMKDSAMVFPVTTRVIEGDLERVMVAPIQTGNCASCHTADGTDGAPGRVIAP
jgi:hypothetical protein